MKQAIRQTAKVLSLCFAGGASMSMLLLFSIILINSLRRYFFGKSLAWGEELPVYIAIYGVMFGTAWAYLQDRHIRFTMLVGFLNRQQERWLFLLVDLIMVVTGGLLCYSGWLFVVQRGAMESSGLISLAKHLRDLSGWDMVIWLGHFYPYQAAMMIGGAMLALAALVKCFLRIIDDGAEPAAGV